jgi:hypothetical protein
VRPAAVLCATLALLAWAGAVRAHPTVAPTFVTAGGRGTVTFVAPNERQTPQTGFSVTVPPELEIMAGGASDVGWPGTVRGSTASWSGCCVAPGAVASFSVDVRAANAPGDVRVEVRQLYPNGERVRWPLPLTVLPGEKQSGSALTVLLVAGLGLVVTVGLVVLVWRRRSPPLQER